MEIDFDGKSLDDFVPGDKTQTAWETSSSSM